MAKSAKTKDKIVFIVALSEKTPRRRPADAGGTRYGRKEVFQALARSFGIVERPVEEVKADLERVVGHIHTVLEAMAASPVGDLKLEGLEIGIAISGEGSIGIATVGAEASVTLQFTKI